LLFLPSPFATFVCPTLLFPQIGNRHPRIIRSNIVALAVQTDHSEALLIHAAAIAVRLLLLIAAVVVAIFDPSDSAAVASRSGFHRILDRQILISLPEFRFAGSTRQ
jgi:hypothetical protein